MKRFISILSFLLFSFPIFSAQVSVDKAENVAKNWYYERSKLAKQEISTKDYFVETEDNDTLFYVFNLIPAIVGVGQEGFVMVSAEDATVPVLGYSFTRHYAKDNHPPQFDAMIECWKKQIKYTRENKLLPSQKIRQAHLIEEWDRLSVSTETFIKKENIKQVQLMNVTPLTTTTWDQPDPYNSQCPTMGGQRCIVGCVAVAMAQVMKYHNWPPRGTGSHSYFDSYGCQQTVSANFNTNYDWANMPNSLVGANQTQIDATAKFLFHCGVSVDMEYTPYGSGAYTQSVDTALKAYFRYDTTVHYVPKSDFSDSIWANMMRTELDSSRPICYAGYDTAQGAGHEFVMDGYQGTDYFHFNWGWEGQDNGYFYLNNLSPGGYDFTTYQECVIGIQPIPSPAIYVMPDTLQFVWYDSVSDTVQTMIVHSAGKMDLNVINMTGNQTWVKSVNPTSFALMPGDSQSVTVVVSHSGLIDGTYFGSVSIYSNAPDTVYNEVIKFISGSSMVRDASPISYANPPFAVKVGSPYAVSFTVQNKGDTTEDFIARCTISPAGLDTLEYSQTSNITDLAAGDSQVVNLPDWIPALYADTYNIVFVTELSGDAFTQNDTLIKQSLTYEQGEIAYDDFSPEAYFAVRGGIGGANGTQDAVGVRFTPVDTLPYYVTEGKVYVKDTTHFEYIGLFSGTASAPALNSPYDKILNPSVGAIHPGWISVYFDTSKTYITALNTSNPIWLVAKFADGLRGPRVGCDENPPMDSNSFWSDSSASGIWQPIYSVDYMMRIIHKQGSSVEENPAYKTAFKLNLLNNPVRTQFSIEYAVPVKTDVNISLYDICGRLVRTIYKGVQKEGSYEMDIKCNEMSNGIYFIKLETSNFKVTKKLAILR